MECVTIKGFGGGTLYYMVKEKRLYLRKDGKNGKTYLACYDTVLSKPNNNKKEKNSSNKRKRDKNYAQCPARCHVDEKSGECWRTEASHSCRHGPHGAHDLIYRDLVSLNAMKDTCRFIAEHFPNSAHKMPIREIFLLEMSK